MRLRELSKYFDTFDFQSQIIYTMVVKVVCMKGAKALDHFFKSYLKSIRLKAYKKYY